MSRAPVRLLEQVNLSGHERALLESAHGGTSIEYDVDKGAARFRAALAALSAAGATAATAHVTQAATGASPTASKAVLIKFASKFLLGAILGASVAGGGLVAGILLAGHRSRVETPAHIAAAESSGRALTVPFDSPSVESSAALALPATAMAVGPAAGSITKHRAPGRARGDSSHPSAESIATTKLANQAAEASDSARISPPPAASASETTQPRQTPAPSVQPEAERPSAVDHPLSEVAGMAMAKALVERDPKAALRVLDDLRRNHPKGYFVEERQALTVLALAADAQTSEAHQQAQAFLRVFPNGPFSDRVRAVLGAE